MGSGWRVLKPAIFAALRGLGHSCAALDFALPCKAVLACLAARPAGRAGIGLQGSKKIPVAVSPDSVAWV
jgi:hypothetical protein